MLAGLLLTTALWTDPGPEAAAGADERPPVAVRVEKPLHRDAVQAWYVSLCRRTAERQRMPAAKAVPELVALYEVLDEAEGFSLARRDRMRAVLRGRVEWYAHRLRKQVAEEARDARRERLRANTDGKPRPPASNEGPAAIGAASLIDLIQRTVNPPIWDVNGGPASVGYFAPFHALVVRAPGEVHHQLGGTLGQLRRVAR